MGVMNLIMIKEKDIKKKSLEVHHQVTLTVRLRVIKEREPGDENTVPVMMIKRKHTSTREQRKNRDHHLHLQVILIRMKKIMKKEKMEGWMIENRINVPVQNLAKVGEKKKNDKGRRSSSSSSIDREKSRTEDGGKRKVDEVGEREKSREESREENRGRRREDDLGEREKSREENRGRRREDDSGEREKSREESKGKRRED